MSIEPVHIGFENIISMNRVIIMLSPKQQPIKRLIQEARSKGMLIDATHARKAKTALILDTGHIVLAAISTEALERRLQTTREEVHPPIESIEV
jgi:regulator of extracellular matrix RemA (YlzA/DUF370 family)